MITYSWKTVWQKSEGNPGKILDIIQYITYQQIPENIYDPVMRFIDTDWSGISFIVNPKPILENRISIYERDLAEYVALASYRSLAEYKATKRTFLYEFESPIGLERLHENRFLIATNDEIHFMWEEKSH